MKSKYTCPECGAGFNEQTAYCEDWRDRDRAFGCPTCHTFFRMDYSKIRNRKKPLLIALILMTSFASLLYVLDAPAFNYWFVLILGFTGYDLAGRFFEGNPKLVLTPLPKRENA